MNDEPAHRPRVRLVDRIRERRARRARRRRLKRTSVLPAMLTLGNGLAGFASIHFATKDAQGQADPVNLAVAAWLILAALVCDMLDGRLARMRRQTSDFGGQLDSLSDVISFGVAPAMLMLRTTIYGMRQLGVVSGGLAIERVIWCVAGAYVACAALRLARFNVESEPAESAHMEFRGLPSPGAAAVIMTLVLLQKSLLDKQWVAAQYLLPTMSVVLPAVTVGLALLMVSRLRYVHPVNHYIRGKRPFEYLVKLVGVVLIGLLQPFIVGAMLAIAFTLSGPVGALWRLARGARPAVQAAGDTGQHPGDET